MAVIYAFPSGVYGQEYMPAEVDEIEITNPLGVQASKAAGQQNEARFRLDVNSFVLHDIVVTITLTRLQNGLVAAPANSLPNGQVWTVVAPGGTQPPWEAKWTRNQIAVGTNAEFTVSFNVGNAAGTHVVTFRVMAAEFATAATYSITHTVT
jgi:hypothetical protein